MFSTQSDNCTPFVHIFDIIFLFAAEMEEPKIAIWGKGLIYQYEAKVTYVWPKVIQTLSSEVSNIR